jgi:hypothetical protein
MFTIIKDSLIPFDENRLKWPWVLMEVGDCAVIDDPALLKRAQNACHVYGGKTGKKFRSRKDGDVLKVWRIA